MIDRRRHAAAADRRLGGDRRHRARRRGVSGDCRRRSAQGGADGVRLRRRDVLPGAVARHLVAALHQVGRHGGAGYRPCRHAGRCRLRRRVRASARPGFTTSLASLIGAALGFGGRRCGKPLLAASRPRPRISIARRCAILAARRSTIARNCAPPQPRLPLRQLPSKSRDFAESRSKMNEQLVPKEKRLTLYPEIVPYRTGRLKVSDLHELYFEECGSPAGKPAVLLHGGPGGGINPDDAPLSRSPSLPHRAVRPAGLRPLDAACLARREHDLAPGRRHRAPARASRDRTLAGVRRLMGLDARARLRRDLPRAGDRARAQGHLHLAAFRTRMVLSGRLQLDLSRRVRGLCERHPARPSAAT